MGNSNKHTTKTVTTTIDTEREPSSINTELETPTIAANRAPHVTNPNCVCRYIPLTESLARPYTRTARAAIRVTVTFDEQSNKKTVLTMRQLLATRAQRDATIGFGAVELGYQTLDKLAQHIASMR